MKIEFIIPTYNRPNHLMTIISSITAQSNDNWKVNVVCDCPPTGSLDKIVDYFKDNEKIKFTFLETRYNDWGHTPRNIGLEMATEEWVVMTGEDNYYTPVFVDEFLKNAEHNTKFVYCDMVHNWVNKEYIYVPAAPIYGRIDIGNFMTRRKFAQQLRLDVKEIAADAKFVEEYINKFPGYVTHIKKGLYVHN
jgi:glycosyltransferase involved in cell wall biosynthesis